MNRFQLYFFHFCLVPYFIFSADTNLSISQKRRVEKSPSPLHRAITDKDNERVQSLSQDQYLRNSKIHPDGNTPLHMAIATKNHMATEILLSHGAKTSIKNRNGKTAYEIAIQQDSSIFFQQLIENYNINKTNDPSLFTQSNSDSETLLHVITRRGDLDKLHLLLDHLRTVLSANEFKKFVDQKNKNEDIALTISLKRRDRDIYWILIMNGATQSNFDYDSIKDKSLQKFVRSNQLPNKVPIYEDNNSQCCQCNKTYTHNDLLVCFSLCKRSFHSKCHKHHALNKYIESAIDPHLSIHANSQMESTIFEDIIDSVHKKKPIPIKYLNYCPGCKEVHSSSELRIYQTKKEV